MPEALQPVPAATTSPEPGPETAGEAGAGTGAETGADAGAETGGDTGGDTGAGTGAGSGGDAVPPGVDRHAAARSTQATSAATGAQRFDGTGECLPSTCDGDPDRTGPPLQVLFGQDLHPRRPQGLGGDAGPRDQHPPVGSVVDLVAPA